MRQSPRLSSFQRLALSTTAATYFLILVGGLVRASGAGLGLAAKMLQQAPPPLALMTATNFPPPGDRLQSFVAANSVPKRISGPGTARCLMMLLPVSFGLVKTLISRLSATTRSLIGRGQLLNLHQHSSY